MTGRWARLLIAIAVGAALNTALTLQNAWPTLWPKPGAGISVELLALLAIMALSLEWRPTIGRPVAWCLAVLLFLLVAGRYAAVTSHSLFGRSINLYFDLPHLPHVAAMAIGGRSGPAIGLFVVIAVTTLVAALLLLRWGVGSVAQVMSDRLVRRSCGALAALGVLIYFAASVPILQSFDRVYAYPVSPVYARQLAFLRDALTGTGKAAALSSVSASDVVRPSGGDVFVIFLESYGEVAYRLPEIAEEVRARAVASDKALQAKGWHAASGFFRSPTFGGGSWLAHASFLSGTVVSENRDYQLLLSGNRATLVRAFGNAGYRTIALMPGLKLAWPEGRFYGFDAIYDAAAIHYGGPAFGWWSIPDQFTMARLDEREMQAPGRSPLFVVYPTIMSHMPFSPVPPYLSDWSRALDPAAYPAPGGGKAALGDWSEARKSYRAAVLYGIDMVEGFLLHRAPTTAVVLVIGDHQPPGIVSGVGANWLVPVHVFSRDKTRIAAFQKAGFKTGVMPSGPGLGDFAALHHKFIEALK